MTGMTKQNVDDLKENLRLMYKITSLLESGKVIEEEHHPDDNKKKAEDCLANGFALSTQSKKKEAVAAYREARALDPEDPYVCLL